MLHQAHYHPKGEGDAGATGTFQWHAHENSPTGHKHAIVAPEASIGWWCIPHQARHPFPREACWSREDYPEGFETCVGIPCTYANLRSGALCHTEACEEVWCSPEDGFRTFCGYHAVRIKAWRRRLRQGHGRDAGHQIAVDALVALASAPYPVDLIDGLQEAREAKEDFDRAARRELLKTIQESITDSSAFAEQEGVQELSEEEGRALFREQCRRYMDMSAEEFAHKWHAGEFDDDPDRPEVMRVLVLLPLFDRRKAP